MLIFTGDVHGNPVDRLNPLRNKAKSGAFPMTKDDFVIITGDFGVLWKQRQDQREASILNWLAGCPWTTGFVCGNHENFDRLDALPVEERFGGKVGAVDPSIFHLRRGEIYELGDYKVFTFGGAVSIDRHWRQEGISWWPREVPSREEEEYALDNLEVHGNKVDIIVTHTMPTSAIMEFRDSGAGHHSMQSMADRIADPVPKFLEHIKESVDFKMWMCGHFHVNQTFSDNITCLYGDVVVISEKDLQ